MPVVQEDKKYRKAKELKASVHSKTSKQCKESAHRDLMDVQE